MRKMTIICLILMSLVSSACSPEIANTQVLEANNQNPNKDNSRQKVDQNLSETNTQKVEHVMQVDKTSMENSKGLIVLSKKYGKNDFVRLYNEDGSIWYEFTYYYDDSDGKFDYENENFVPFSFHPDYFLLALKCVGQDENRYEVIVNEETGLRKFVKKTDSTLKFETWEEHITKAFAVTFNQKINPLRETPEGKSKNDELSKDVTFQPVEIKGDWLKVRWDDLNNKKNSAGFGWIKWREKGSILVELFNLS